MPAKMHHTIIPATDREQAARYFAELLELRDPQPSGMFSTVILDDEIVVNFAEPRIDFSPQHFAFLVDDAHFDRILSRFERDGTEYWADPQRRRPGELGTIDHVPQGRRLYFLGPDGHYLEVLTARYVWDAEGTEVTEVSDPSGTRRESFPARVTRA